MPDRGQGRLFNTGDGSKKRVIFASKPPWGKHAKSVDSQVLARILRKGKGQVFTPSDFLDLGSRRAVGLALMRHTKAATIRKLARGLYDYPRQDSRLGRVAASTEEIANALKGRDNVRSSCPGAMPQTSLESPIRCRCPRSS